MALDTMAVDNSKTYICDDKDCNNYFRKYKSTDKWCSYVCAVKNTKPLKRTELKRTPLNPSGWTPEPMSQKRKDKFAQYKKKANKRIKDKVYKSDFENEFTKAKKRVKDRVVKMYGRLKCEKCKCTSSIQFSVHHIIFRSERPKHPELNNIKNLLYLCFDCHEWFHKRKRNRNVWVKKLELWELFGTIWGCDDEIEETLKDN